MNLRSFLYQAARLLGDANAIAKGKFLQRLVRSRVHAKIGTLINRLIK
jgi:hypothetical protein